MVFLFSFGECILVSPTLVRAVSAAAPLDYHGPRKLQLTAQTIPRSRIMSARITTSGEFVLRMAKSSWR